LKKTVTNFPVPPRMKPRLRLPLTAAGGVATVLAILAAAFLHFSGTPTVSPPAARIVRVAANQVWQDTGVDMPTGCSVTVAPEGFWRKQQTLCPSTGLEAAPRERSVLPEAPLMCLLARIGDGSATAVLQKQVLQAKHGGRLFLQANDLDLAANSDSVTVAIDGGLPSDERAPALPLLPIQAGERELASLLSQTADVRRGTEQRRDEVFDFCVKYAGTPAAFRAGQELLKLPPLVNSMGMKLAPIPPGNFLMGSPDNESQRQEHEGPQHKVTLTRPFYLGVYPVTLGQFRAFVTATQYQTGTVDGAYRLFPDGTWQKDPNLSWENPGFAQTDDHPVVGVTWNDARAFCEWLSRKEGRKYGLPTEAEWEYSCRAGTKTRWYNGNDVKHVKDVANVRDESLNRVYAAVEGEAWDDGFAFTAPVGTFQPNAFGLYDMHGNVWQWCQDVYDKDYYQRSPKQDPLGPLAGTACVRRGGGWGSFASGCRSASRSSNNGRSHRSDSIGFRVVLR
jgi:formylglycine-generating enzyme required for sulfatase activity